MAFGQQAGPPASATQLRELLSLLRTAGHDDFRDARGPMGFSQRQAAGKFTRDEATAFIGRLQETGADDEHPVDVGPAAARPAPGDALRGWPAQPLAEELRRRGWTVIAP